MMPLKADLLELTDPRWGAMASSRPDGLIFHQPAWIKMLSDCYGYRPAVFALTGEDGRMAAGLPLMFVRSWLTGRRVSALPFSDFCPPLAEDAQAQDCLIEALQRWRSKNDVREVQVHWQLPAGSQVYPGKAFARHLTQLEPDSRLVYARFSNANVTWRIRKAEKVGLTTRIGADWEDMRLFYRLHLKTRQRLGVPIQPLRFFRLLWEQVIAPGMGFIILTYQESRLLAGAVFLHSNNTLVYKFGASDQQFWKLHPNNLLFWHAIRWGCEHGYSLLDWGRTDLDDEGLRHFKLGWGSTEQIVPYTVLSSRAPGLAAGGRLNRSLAKFIRHSPAWVCQMMGELFYSHFGS
jgi:CelD/BcsL family acetyltransferase involved in cellulose biosynthesis